MDKRAIKNLLSKISKERFTVVGSYLDSLFSMFAKNSLVVYGSTPVRQILNVDGSLIWSIVDLQRQLFLEKFFNKYKFTIPIDSTAVDSVSFRKQNRFNLVVIIGSLTINNIFQIGLRGDVLMPTLSKILPGFSWCERECWDMFGIIFMGHNDLRRLLTDYGFRGFPLRKDFPVVGFFEVCYDEELGQLINVPVSLAQEMRVFDYAEYKD